MRPVTTSAALSYSYRHCNTVIHAYSSAEPSRSANSVGANSAQPYGLIIVPDGYPGPKVTVPNG